MELMSLVPHEQSWTENYRSCPRVIHNCEVPKEPDEVESLVTGSGFFDRIRRWIIRKSILSKKHPITRTCIKSTAAVNYEISRHIRSHPYTIYPFSQIRSFWEVWMTLFTIASLIIVPLLLAFGFDALENSFYVFLPINTVFVVDIVMTFITGHYDASTRIVILDRKIIIWIYLKGFFILDVLSSIPIHVVYAIATGRKAPKWYWTLLDFAKIFRLRTVVLYSRKLRRVSETRQLYGISYHKYKLFEMTTIVTICVHWSTCLQLYVALVGRELSWKTPNRGSWLMSESVKEKDTSFKLYWACANRAVISLVGSSHYLDVKTIEDILLNLLLTVVGRGGFIYIIAQFFQLLATLHSTSKKDVKFLQQLQDFMHYKELSHTIQQRLLDYNTFCHKKSFERNKHIISNVSPNLREELLIHNYSRLISGVDFFRHLPQPVIGQVVGLVRTEVYLTNDTIVKAGTPGDAFFFIASGTVAIFTNNDKEDGSHFGEVSLVMEDEQRTASVLAVETCEIWMLKRSDFVLCLKPYPNLLNRLQKFVVEHLEKNLISDTSHRLTQGNVRKKMGIDNNIGYESRDTDRSNFQS